MYRVLFALSWLSQQPFVGTDYRNDEEGEQTAGVSLYIHTLEYEVDSLQKSPGSCYFNDTDPSLRMFYTIK